MLRGPEGVWLRRIARPTLALFVPGMAAFEIIYCIIAHRGYSSLLTGPIVSTIRFSLIDLFAGLVILFSLASRGRVFRFLNFKPLNRLGQISYGFYVFHDIPHDIYIHIVRATYGTGPYQNFVAAIALAFTAFLAYFSFRFFEARFLHLKTHFTPRNA